MNASERPEYGVWHGMRRRCRDPRVVAYPYYGGRGIKVCDRWRLFANFLADMGERPTPEHSIERRDVNGDYEPSNCYWATWTEQCRNKRNTVAAGDRPLIEQAEMLGLKYQTVYMRRRRGMALNEVLRPGHFKPGHTVATEPRAGNASGFRGVSRKRDRWRATIVQDGKQVSLGSFLTPEEAHAAYLTARAKLMEGAWPIL